MSYRELVVELAREHAEALSDALLDLGALSVSVEDADADTPDEQPLFGEPGLVPDRTAWQHSRVVALLSADHEPAVLLAAATNEIGLAETPQFVVREVEEQDWVRLTQSQFEPIPIGERIWVVPSWHDAPDPDALVLELDPGLAFGTGSHPTTRLCMEWLEQSVKPGQSVLDYGCGSGILAILAKKCGANPVIGIDIDPQAVESARQNSERNRAEVTYGLPDACPDGEFDIVVANILSNPLKLMASMLASKVKPGGRIALSGVLARQADEVAAVYARYVDISVWREHEGWVCLAGTRRESH
ncbi:50S ribosomal protein L11 methyltransferase [Burkholderia cenocepacia]|uniref:Ribosomal protein L11 methyltransferase n=1 Tax=Burkholderia cenocepacia (strain ATCC BAA-245 / DSM 16553 / LMG 16656 / NCTC 13227 / J2315 / CF5610) TaxID=216591 RepID=PRMA_BURCJ|nr:50S ribosomal protein L11 methyltransferase [Burkholderia cenocepacia]B4E5V2.1 RecName: Full=Ribosomal protein L11 methyltransferase; Short=L11 Mtase [Burkholderia cenocepacia J2315]KIS49258.1 ribosomal protein L11 methyltransferase [Burkholderia cepacia]EPZ91682.1 ribosomal protein L11 methyltransferase [Burkholderia cenocepacia K56-2Valvano]ERI30972.1 ribosomal protein L11 methyltransferase [Burkholderia cenocepacia BC7]KKI84008.1 ribosomal protein L11 methyltransferase [Burkholderia ceno